LPTREDQKIIGPGEVALTIKAIAKRGNKTAVPRRIPRKKFISLVIGDTLFG
jgi:hypothetical protein